MDAFGGWSKDLNGAVPIGGGPKKDAEIPFVSKPERWTHFGDSDSVDPCNSYIYIHYQH